MLVGWVDFRYPTNQAIKLGFLQIKPIATHIRKIYHFMYGRANPVVKEHRLKIDPGSKVTGLAILKENRVVFAAELTHRGLAIKATLESRRAIRRGRRNRHTRYRKPRFNRFRPTGWLAPSLQHRVDTTLTCLNYILYLDHTFQN